MTEAWAAGAAVERLRTVRAMILQEAAGAYIDREAAGDTRLAEALAMLREALGVRDIFGYSELNDAIRAAEAEARALGAQGASGEFPGITDDWPDDGQPTDDRPDDRGSE